MADIFNFDDLWDAANVFESIRVNVTDTQSNAGSSLIYLDIGGVIIFRVDKSGDVVITGNIVDSTNNELIILAPIAGAVNEITVVNASTGNDPLLAATGDDATINLQLQGKGAGGGVVLEGLKYPLADGTANQIIETNGAGTLTFVDQFRNVVEDTTPQLGGNLDVNGNSIVSVSAGNIPITPDTTGSIVLDGLSWPQADGSLNQVIETDGAGQLSFATRLANVVEDTTPQLGGNLDVNGSSIVSVSTGDIAITPDTTGSIVLDGLNWPQADGTANQIIETDGAGQLNFVDKPTSTPPGGADTNVQFNNSGAFGGDASLTWDGSAFVVNNFSISTVIATSATRGASISNVAGTESAAVYGFVGSQNTGMYSITTGVLGFATNGTEAIAIGATQGVILQPGASTVGLIIGLNATTPGSAIIVNQSGPTTVFEVKADGSVFVGPTWNDGGTVFDAFFCDVTNTASEAGSSVIRVSVDGTDVFRVGKNGEVSIGGVTPVAGTRLLLPQEADLTTPTLAFGDGDTGFTEASDDNLAFISNGVRHFQLDSAGFFLPTSSGAGIKSGTSFSSTEPTVFCQRSDLNTGVGSAAADQLSLIAGGVEVVRVDVDATAANTRLLIYDIDNAALERVSVGAADSGGSGFKLLRIAN